MANEPSTSAPPQASRLVVSRKRYLVNSGVLILVAVLAVIWFELHVKHEVRENLLIGGTLTLWGLCQLVFGVWSWTNQEAVESLPKRILGGRSSTELLLVAGVLIGVLYFFTSSIHVEYVPVKDGAPKYEVSVTYKTNDLPFLERLHVTSDERMAGRAFFFRWRSVPLQIALTEPRGYKPKEILFTRAQSVHLRVPEDFERKTFRLLRLVPATGMIDHLAEPGGTAVTQYDLEIVVGAITNTLTDWRRQTVYVGAAKDDLDMVVRGEKAEARHKHFNDYLARVMFPEADRSARVRFWEDDPLLFATTELKAGDPVSIVVRRAGEAKPVVQTNHVMGRNDEIETQFIESQ